MLLLFPSLVRVFAVAPTSTPPSSAASAYSLKPPNKPDVEIPEAEFYWTVIDAENYKKTGSSKKSEKYKKPAPKIKKKFQCILCEKIYASKYSAKIHLKKFHHIHPSVLDQHITILTIETEPVPNMDAKFL
jgi:hypothetical protein